MPDTTHNDTFKQSFREEAHEILVELEASLLELNENPGSAAQVGSVFRALHTIKGSGAMFGFDDLAAFTHNLESAFDAVRTGRLSITPELIDLTLAALDQIRAMLGGGGDPGACDGILARLHVMLGAPAAASPGTQEAAADRPSPASSSDQAPSATAWRLYFAPGPELARNGSDPLLLLQELAALGALHVEASLASLPPLAELEPERCYIAWEMTLTTTVGEDVLRDVFIFVEDYCALRIEPALPAPGDAAPSPADLTARALQEKRSERGGRRHYDKPDSATSLRVPAAKLDQFVDLVGEMVTVQARLSEIAARSENPEMEAVSEEIERLIGALRETSMNIRMLPIRSTFERFRRLVHDLARDLGKNVELTIDGAETELDKTVIEQLNDPLMHLIRNSMDHGIEPPEVRLASGKRPNARIHLSARYSGASVLIAISDDGGGIDAEAVRRRAIEKGLASPESSLTEAEIYQFIFAPGFSTAARVTDVSGRGVGMDVVRQHVESLHGSIDVASTRGAGTTVTLRLPLTLAIIDGLLVAVGDACFVLPLAATQECIELTRDEIDQAKGKHMVNVRGEIVPYIRLREYFEITTPQPQREHIMIADTGEGRYGFVVDHVLGNRQTVIKSLGRLYRHVSTLSGATILGDGTVALILDPQRLVQDALRNAACGTPGRPRAGPRRDDAALPPRPETHPPSVRAAQQPGR